MKTSPAGVALLAKREGMKLRAYQDTKGIWTIGVGHTSAAGPPKVIPGLRITKAQAIEILSRDLTNTEAAVNRAVTVPMEQDEFDAFVSLAFNIGNHGFETSTVVRRFNIGDRKGAAAAFLLWNKPPEIILRRKNEMKQFIAAAPK